MNLRVLAVALLLVTAGCVQFVPDEGTTSGPTGGGGGVAVQVVSVIDGDTVRVEFQNGSRDTVRLLGVDTPEVRGGTDPTEFEGVPDTEAGRACLRVWADRASEFATDRLDGTRVRLEFDSESDRRDRYGRLLAYVVVDGRTFNYRLLTRGYARFYDSPIEPYDRYRQAEVRAREEGVGLWGECATEQPGTSGPLAVSVTADASGDDRENLNGEYVVLRNVVDRRLDLSGWTVSDESGAEYVFAEGTTLEPGATLTLYTGAGEDTASKRYWDQSRPVWNNDGDVVTVTAANGTVVVRHAYGSASVERVLTGGTESGARASYRATAGTLASGVRSRAVWPPVPPST